ncbi:MAG: cell envelope integrity protein TolA [Methyloligellaceae bacterium]
MKHSILSWAGAFIFTLAGFMGLFSYTGGAPEVLVERSSGATVAIIGGGIIAELESEKESTVESKTSKEVKADPEPEPEKEPIEKPVEKVEEKQPEPVKEAPKEPVKETQKDPIKEVKAAETPEVEPEKAIAKQENKKEEKKPEPPKKVVKKKETEKPKPKKKKVVRKKKKRSKASRAQRRSGRRVDSARKGGGARGRQKNISGNAARSNFLGQVNSRLARFKQYPADARRRGTRGKVVVRFSISASGALRSVSVVRSSGTAILDRAALSTVRRASPFPRLPSGMSAPQSFTAPIDFTIR